MPDSPQLTPLPCDPRVRTLLDEAQAQLTVARAQWLTLLAMLEAYLQDLEHIIRDLEKIRAQGEIDSRDDNEEERI